MYEGHSLQLAQLMPRGMKPDDVMIAMAGIAAFLCVLAIGGNFVNRSPHSRAQLKALQERRRELRRETMGHKQRKRPETSMNFMRAVVTRLQLLKKSQIGKSESKLVEAGFRSHDAIYVVAFFTLVLPIVLGLAGFAVFKMGDAHSKFHLLSMIWPVLGAYVGLKLPWMFVNRRRKKRYLHIQRALSDVLDLMTICAEAGLSLSAALSRVAHELALAYREMAEELSFTYVEMSFMPDRNKALLNLAERVQLPEVRNIVSMLVQTEKYGTPIAQALRVLAAEFRETRMLRAEQKAARLPALMTVPMMLFVLPTLFIVIIAPAGIKVADAMHH